MTKFDAIDNYRNNWWCDLTPQPVDKNAEPKEVGPASPEFLTMGERSVAEAQWRELTSVGAAPNYFGRVVLQWAKDHPGDDRLPEALHLVVRATRYGCSDAGTGTISKQAYDLLHSRYPNSSWAKRTPYWFK